MQCSAVRSLDLPQLLQLPRTDTPMCAAEFVSAVASLLDLRLGDWGLPDFEDRLEGAVLLQPPWTMQGQVVKGFGRGSKDLGIPTANIDAASLQVARSSMLVYTTTCSSSTCLVCTHALGCT